MNTTTRSSNIIVLLHQVDKGGNSCRLEVDVPIKGEEVSVLGTHLLPFAANWLFRKLESQQVVHVHDLGPTLLVSNLGLVLQVDDHLGLARKSVDQPSTIGRGHLLWGPQPNIGLMNRAASLVDAINKILNEFVHLHPVLPPSLLLIAHLKSVVEKDVGLELVIIGVHHRIILPVLPSTTLVF